MSNQNQITAPIVSDAISEIATPAITRETTPFAHAIHTGMLHYAIYDPNDGFLDMLGKHHVADSFVTIAEEEGPAAAVFTGGVALIMVVLAKMIGHCMCGGDNYDY
jgi:hypothetical protein